MSSFVFSVLAERSAGKSISKMSYFMSSGTKKNPELIQSSDMQDKW